MSGIVLKKWLLIRYASTFCLFPFQCTDKVDMGKERPPPSFRAQVNAMEKIEDRLGLWFALLSVAVGTLLFLANIMGSETPSCAHSPRYLVLHAPYENTSEMGSKTSFASDDLVQRVSNKLKDFATHGFTVVPTKSEDALPRTYHVSQYDTHHRELARFGLRLRIVRSEKYGKLESHRLCEVNTNLCPLPAQVSINRKATAHLALSNDPPVFERCYSVSTKNEAIARLTDLSHAFPKFTPNFYVGSGELHPLMKEEVTILPICSLAASRGSGRLEIALYRSAAHSEVVVYGHLNEELYSTRYEYRVKELQEELLQTLIDAGWMKEASKHSLRVGGGMLSAILEDSPVLLNV